MSITTTKMRLKVFFYILLRDHLTFGEVNKLMKIISNKPTALPKFTDKLILKRANHIIETLETGKYYND